METKDTLQGILGLKFAQALAAGEYETAYKMLSPKLASEYSVARLQQTYEKMVDFAKNPATDLMVMNNKDEKFDAEGWAYISISGIDWPWSEAVTITAKSFGREYLIDELKWCRP